MTNQNLDTDDGGRIQRRPPERRADSRVPGRLPARSHYDGYAGERRGISAEDAAAQLDPMSNDSSDHIYPEDIDEWAERLDVTREQLRVAVRRVGSRVDEVARFLGNPDIR